MSICTSTMGMAWLSTKNTRAPLGWVQCWMGKDACAQPTAPQQASSKAERRKTRAVMDKDEIKNMG
jgi:hypothetical protein